MLPTGSQNEAYDDLVQEGYIAMWRAVESFNPDAGPADYWLKSSASRRMLTVVCRNHYTGQTRRENGGHGGSQPQHRVLSFDELATTIGLEVDAFEVEDVLAARALDDVELSYHHGEIARALGQLTIRERAYVVRRFYFGWIGPQLDLYFDTHAANIWKTARPKLAKQLAYLASA